MTGSLSPSPVLGRYIWARQWGLNCADQIVSYAAAGFDPQVNRIKRRAVEFRILAVGYANGATPRTQLWTHDRKLGCQAIGFIERDMSVFEDHAALVFELFAYDEIKIE